MILNFYLKSWICAECAILSPWILNITHILESILLKFVPRLNGRCFYYVYYIYFLQISDLENFLLVFLAFRLSRQLMLTEKTF